MRKIFIVAGVVVALGVLAMVVTQNYEGPSNYPRNSSGEPSWPEGTLVVIDDLSGKPVAGATVEVHELCIGPLSSGGDNDCTWKSKEKTDADGRLKILAPNAFYGYFALVKAIGYLDVYNFFDGDRDITIKMVPFNGSVLPSEEAAIVKARENKKVKTWLIEHPVFDSLTDNKYRVDLYSPDWWVTFQDSTARGTISIRMRAATGETLEVKTD